MYTDQQLSEHFKLSAFVKSHTAIKLGIDNTPSVEAIAKIKDWAVNIGEKLWTGHGPVSINSGYRCLALNNAISGAKKSQHMDGEAADIEIPGHTNIDVASWIINNIIDFDQLILENYVRNEPYSGWVHVSFTKSSSPRKSVLTKFWHESAYHPGLIVK
ncbi:MAG: hypothetical protein HQK89_04670 [Nitrospirae bacterium]|nr:hypothetical protein [Nitrospirota bacterium]